MRTWAAAATALLAFVAAACQQGEEELPDYGRVPEFRLVDSHGESFGRDARGAKVWIANFIFTTCPSFCPRLTQQMGVVQRGLRGVDGVRFVSFSVDPEHDTPERLRAYAEEHGATDSWSFVTGPRAAVYELVRSGFKLALEEPPSGGGPDGNGIILHSDRFVLVDATGTIRGYYRGTEDESVSELIAAAKQLAAR